MNAARWGTLVVAHGSIKPEWPALVARCVPQQLRGAEGPVALAFLEEVPDRAIDVGLAELEAAGCTHAVVVPLFLSSASLDVAEVRYLLGLGPKPPKAHVPQPFRTSLRLVGTNALDSSPEVGEILLERALALTDAPERTALVLAGHGSRHVAPRRAWQRQLGGFCRQIRAEARFRRCTYGLLSPDALGGIARKLAARGTVAVVPAMLSGGYFTGQVAKRLEGIVQCRYSGEPLLPHPLIGRWIERQAATGRR